MAKLNIDIGVNLGTAIRDLGTLKNAFDNVSLSLEKFTTQVNTLKTSLGQLKSTNVNVNVSQNVSQIAKPVNLAPVVPTIDISKFQAALEQLKPKLFADIDIKADKLIAESNAKIAALQANINSKPLNIKVNNIPPINPPIVPNVFGPFNKGATDAGKSATYANMALVDTGRIIQDLPYGFLGISNNLNPLIESFRALKVEAAASNQSVGKLLLSSLSGFGGVGIAISAVSAALSFASIGLSYWNRNTKEAKPQLTDLQKELKKTSDEFKSFKENVVKSSAEEIVEVNKLMMVLNDETETRKRKNAAIKELVKINPDIFEGLKNEEGSLRNLNTLYDKYITNIRNVIASKIIQKQIEDKTTELLKTEKIGLTDLEKFLFGTTDATQKDLKTRADYIKSLGGNADALEKFNKNLDQSSTSTQGLTRKGNILKTEIADLYKQLQKFSKSFKLDVELDKTGGKNKLIDDREKAPRTFAAAIKEIKDDVQIIRENPLFSQGEKDQKVVARLQEGVRYLRDTFKIPFEVNIMLPTGDVNQLFRELSKAEIDLNVTKAKDDLQSLRIDLVSLKEIGSIINESTTQESINAVSNRLRGLAGQIASLKMIPVFPGLEKYRTEQVTELIAKYSDFGVLLKRLKEIRTAEELTELWEKYKIKTNEAVDSTELINDALNNINADPLSGLRKNIEGQIKGASEDLRRAASFLSQALEKTGGKETPITEFFRNDIEKSKKLLEKLGEELKFQKSLEELNSSISDSFNNLFEGLFDGLGSIIAGSSAKDAFKGLFSALTESLGNALIKFALQAQAVKLVIDRIRTLLFAPGPAGLIATGAALALGIALKAASKALSSKGFAKGGFVSGDGSATSDSVPARLSNGEYVIRAASVQKYGKGFMDSINYGTFAKYADGGLVNMDTRWRALVNRSTFDIPGLEPIRSRALVNRAAPPPSNSGFIAETRISGQDLRLILNRADSRFKNIS